jgi:hypothetical protein
MEIPVTLELLSKNEGNHSNTKLLKPGKSFTSNPNDTDNLPLNCNATEITYHLVGFNGYIDEDISIPLDQEKLLATLEKRQKEEPAEKPEEDNKSNDSNNPNNEKQQSEANKEDENKSAPAPETVKPEPQANPENQNPTTKTPVQPVTESKPATETKPVAEVNLGEPAATAIQSKNQTSSPPAQVQSTSEPKDEQKDDAS